MIQVVYGFGVITVILKLVMVEHKIKQHLTEYHQKYFDNEKIIDIGTTDHSSYARTA